MPAVHAAEDLPAAAARQPAAPAEAVATREEKLASVGDGPEDREALEALALAFVADGDVVGADAAYARLLEHSLGDHAVALRYAVARLHLRQEYEAHATLFATVHSREKDVDTVTAAAAALDRLYGADGLSSLLRDQFPDPEQAADIDAIVALWRDVFASPPPTTHGRHRHSPSAVLGNHPARSFLALYYGFASIVRGQYDAGKSEFRTAIATAHDERTAGTARAGYKLLEGIEAGAPYPDLLDSFYLVSLERNAILDTSTGLFPILDRMNDLVRNGDVDGAAELLDAFRRLPMGPMQGGRYFVTRGEIRWGQGLYGLAAQDFQAASAVSDEPSVISTALFGLARYADRTGDRDQAVDYARRSADAAPDLGYRQRDVADFLIGLGLEDEGICYSERAIAAADTAQAVARGYYELAERYRALGDSDGYHTVARDYIGAVERMGDGASADERGNAAWYRGVLLAAENKPEEAAEAYEVASTLLTDPHRLAEIHFLLAERQAGLGRPDAAAALAEKSLAALPDEGWKIRQIADFYDRIGMPERAVDVYREAMARTAAPHTRADRLRDLTEHYRLAGDTENYLRSAAQYRELLQSPGYDASDDEKGLAAFYQAEIHLASGDRDAAHQADLAAVGLLEEPLLRYEVFRRMAEYAAAHGDREAAAMYVENATEERPEQWVFQWAGDVLFRLDLPDKAYAAYDRAVKLSDPDDGATAYAVMADAFHSAGATADFVRYARLYSDAVASRRDAATDAQTGLAAYYTGKLLAEQGKPDEAYTAYGQAAPLLADAGKRAEAYMLMARYQAARGEAEKAAQFAGESLAIFPDEDWKIREVADVYVQASLPDKAVELYSSRLERAETAHDRAAALRDLADLSGRLQQREQELRYAALYRDAVLSAEADFSADERGTAHYYDGEIRDAAGESDAAAAYRAASELLTDDLLLSDVFQKLAVLSAAAGDREAAREYALLSAEKRPEDWVFSRTGDFLLSLDMPEDALAAFDRAVKTTAPDDDWTAFSIVAEAYKARGNADAFSRYATRYAEAVAAREADAAPAELGLASYYRGQVFFLANQPDQAYRAYEKAGELLDDPAKLYEMYTFMAEHDAGRGQLNRAAYYAGKTLEVVDNEEWRSLDAADLFLRVGMEEEAIALYTRLIEDAHSPRGRAEAIANLAELYKRLGNRDEYLAHAIRYRDLVLSPGSVFAAAEQGRAWYYQGEISAAADQGDEAMQAYRKAADCVTDNLIASDALHTLASLEAERGNRDEAALLAERSAELRPEDWVFMRTGRFLLELAMPDRALPYFDQAATMADPDNTAGAYAIMADWYGNHGDNDEQARYTALYIDAVDAKGEKASADERGLAEYYRGKTTWPRRTRTPPSAPTRKRRNC